MIRSWAGVRLRSWYGQAAGPVLLAALGLDLPGWVQVGLFVAGAALTTASLLALSWRRQFDASLLEQATGRLITQRLLDLADLLESHHPEVGGRFRANVMLVHGSELAMAYRSRGYTPDEETIRWARGQGAAGQAWAQGRTVCAPDEEHPLPALGQSRGGTSSFWHLSPEQLHCTVDVRMVVSVPIFHLQDRQRVVGVLSVDDTLPPGPAAGVVIRAAENLAQDVERSVGQTRRALE